jgi:hypothetical protein
MSARCSANSVPHPKYKNKLHYLTVSAVVVETKTKMKMRMMIDSNEDKDETGAGIKVKRKTRKNTKMKMRGNTKTNTSSILVVSVFSRRFYDILLYDFVDDDISESKNNPRYHLASGSSLHASTKRQPGGDQSLERRGTNR